MKKLLVLLLTLAFVGGAFAEVTVAIKASGSVYLANDPTGTGEAPNNFTETPYAYLSPNGAGYDVLTIKGKNKDGTAGIEVQDNNLFSDANLTISLWNVWFQNTWGKVTLGQLDTYTYGYVQTFNNGWLENYDPVDFIDGYGVLYESPELMPGLKVAAFLPTPYPTVTAGPPKVAANINTIDLIKTSMIGLSYAIGETATVVSEIKLGLVDEDTTFNVGFDFTGVEKLDVYGWFEYATLEPGTMGFGVGGQYKEATWRAGAEFEATSSDGVLIADFVANFRYYVMPTFFVQVRPEYYMNGTEGSPTDGRVRVRGYANYAFGNGFGAELMAGYDTIQTEVSKGYKGEAATVYGDGALIYYLRLTYSVSF